MKHLVDMLLGATRVALPRTAGTTVVVEGKRITDVRQLVVEDKDPDELARLRSEVRRAKERAYYHQHKHDPEFQAKRAAYAERTREERRAWKREYDQRTKERQRKQKTDWARRNYVIAPDKQRAASKAYYERNREAILARRKASQKAKREAARAAEGTR